MKNVYNLGLCLFLAGSLTSAPLLAQSGLPPSAQSTKGKVSAALLGVASPAASTIQSPANSPVADLEVANDIPVYNGYVVIEALPVTGDAKQLLSDLQERGLKHGTAYGAMVSGLMPVGELPDLQLLGSLRYVRPAYAPETNVGSVTSQGDKALGSDLAREKFGLDGKGFKVGILSDSYDNLGGEAAGIASGDLPDDVEVLLDLDSTGSDEGRGMAEIVHDVAPGADIAFRTAFLGQPDFAQGIEDLQAAGCDVIVDDVTYFAEPYFSPGVISQAVNKVARKGSAYFSSAGNAAQKSYEAPFRNSGEEFFPTDTVSVGEAHDFGNGDIRQSVRIAPGQRFRIVLQWDDPFFSATNGERGAETDLDLFVMFDTILISASQDLNIGADPVETVAIVNNSTTDSASVDLVITKVAGPDPTRIKYVNFRDAFTAEYDTRSSTVLGHSNALRGVAVGAARYNLTPKFNDTLESARIESFSSLGGTPILFTDDGRRLRRARVYRKPEVTGPNGGNTSDFPLNGFDLEGDGFPNFFGTSASAPHVAAVAALMLEATHGYISPIGITGLLALTAGDMDNPLTPGFDRSFDFKTGYGFVRADKALKILGYGRRILTGRGDLAEDAETFVNEQSVALFPNPSSGPVTFRASSENEEAVTLTLHNSVGQQVFAEEFEQPIDFTEDFSALPKGMYIARVHIGGEVTTQTLVFE